jgi:branched-chain amino acid transport system ATP-binding protein
VSAAPAPNGLVPVRGGSVPALAMQHMKAAYGRIEVVHGIDVEIGSGTVTALLGPNGAGKSTTLTVASGRMRPTSGTVLINGIDCAGTSNDALARAGLCSIPEGRAVFPNLTVLENIRMWTFRGGIRRSEVEERSFRSFPVLANRRKQLAGTLSGGEQQMLAMSRALSTDPSILLLDEISMGLAPIVVSGLYEHVAQIAASGTSILIVEQFANTVLAVANHVLVMAQGRIVHSGPPTDVREALAEIYLRSRSS